MIIGIFSGKGGVGKTTTTVNLSTVFAQLNKNVIAVDTDIKMSGLGLQLGMYKFPVTLNDVIISNKNIHEALYIHQSGLRIIPAALHAEEVDTTRLKTILSSPFLSNNFVFVDSPPGLEKNAMDVLQSCQSGIVVVTPDTPSLVDALKITSEMQRLNVKPLGAIVNMCSNEKSEINTKEIESFLNLPVLGCVPFDKEVRRSVFHRTPVVAFNKHSPAAVEFKKIGARLLGQEYKTEKFFWIKSMLKRLKK